jgi:hypothetical protein
LTIFHRNQNLFVSLTEGNQPDIEPIFGPCEPDGMSRNVRGRLLLNSYTQVCARFGRPKRAVPRNLQALLQSIFAKDPKSQVSMNYLEGLMFPYIFPMQSVDGAVIGSLPHSMFTQPLNQGSSRGHIGTLTHHMNIRSNDLSLTTASEVDYSAFSYDVIMNEKLNYNMVSLLLKKGPEFLGRNKGDGLDIGAKDTGMLFDKIENHGPVNELAAFNKTMGKADYFITVTANQERTPGLSRVRKQLLVYANRNRLSEYDVKALMLGFMPLMMQTFYRTIRYMWEWIAHGGDKPCGHVKAFWYR